MRAVISCVAMFLSVFLCPTSSFSEEGAGPLIQFLEPLLGTWNYSTELETFYGESGKTTDKGQWVAAFCSRLCLAGRCVQRPC